jgi:hypothetical protein
MAYSDIRTVRDYLTAISLLHQGPRGDDYRSGADQLAKLAETMIFKAKKHDLTSQGHREYKLNYHGMLEEPKLHLYLPIVLTDSTNYELGPRISILTANHLDDKVEKVG